LRRGIQSGEFQDVDDLLTKALDALERDPSVFRKPKNTREEAVAHLIETSKVRHLPHGVTIRELLNKRRD
jgi:hypothetical protein